MKASQRTVFRFVIFFMLIAAGITLYFGIPENCNTAGSTCTPMSLRTWWDDGAQINESTIQANTQNGSFWSSDIVSQAFARVSEKIADGGSVIWNPIASNVATRILLGGLMIAAAYDLLKTLIKKAFANDGGTKDRELGKEP